MHPKRRFRRLGLPAVICSFVGMFRSAAAREPSAQLGALR